MTVSDRGVGLDLDAIEKRATAATAPSDDASNWVIEAGSTGYEVFSGPLSQNSSDVALSIFRRADAEFIAAARTDVPALVAEVRRLREALGECYGGDGEPHRFEPGIDVDMVAEGRSPDPRWCNVCGETRAVSS